MVTITGVWVAVTETLMMNLLGDGGVPGCAG
jgi:hypothetical protein